MGRKRAMKGFIFAFWGRISGLSAIRSLSGTAVASRAAAAASTVVVAVAALIAPSRLEIFITCLERLGKAVKRKNAGYKCFNFLSFNYCSFFFFFDFCEEILAARS